MEDRVRVTVPAAHYRIADVIALSRRTGRKYEVSETAATGSFDFMDNPDRAGREVRTRHTGEEIMSALAGLPGAGKVRSGKPTDNICRTHCAARLRRRLT